MLKIGQQQKGMDAGNLLGTTQTSYSGISDNEPSAFSQALQRTQDALQQETMDKLMKMIDVQSQKLLKSPVLAEMTVYRELIRRFLKEATAKTTKVDRRIDRRNRPLTLVRDLDEKLSELTEQVMSGQANPIGLLALVNEIRGLLVDFLI